MSPGERYYWAHTKPHESTQEQTWLKGIVVAAFEDGLGSSLIAIEDLRMAREENHRLRIRIEDLEVALGRDTR